MQNYYAFEVGKGSPQPVVKELGVTLANHKDAYFAKCAAK
ncbi:Uncharacterised protein [Mycobacteroides abscessus subsp. abscessus]|nr:Uncharacterised protein [Mycobacteroides abscessus subsp. abscessus]